MQQQTQLDGVLVMEIRVFGQGGAAVALEDGLEPGEEQLAAGGRGVWSGVLDGFSELGESSFHFLLLSVLDSLVNQGA